MAFYALNGFTLEQFEDHCFYVKVLGGPYATQADIDAAFPLDELPESDSTIIPEGPLPTHVDYPTPPRITERDGLKYIKILDRHRNLVND